MLNRLLLISGLLCLFIAEGVFAQQVKVVAETDDFTDYEFLNEDLIIQSPYGLTVPVAGNSPRYQVLEQAVVTIENTLPREKQIAFALASDDAPLIESSEAGIYRGKKVSPVSINISRVGENEVLVLKKLRLRVYKEGDRVFSKAVTTNQRSNAAFDNGTWYKIPIRTNSIYEIDADYLEELGIELSTIDPRNIQVWGTGGYALPELNSANRPQLTEIPIMVEGQNDGTFNPSDRILFYANSPHKVTHQGNSYSHEIHPYSNENYVFLTIADSPGQRLSPVNNSIVSPSRTLTTFKDFIWKDEELQKPEATIKSGRYWLGKRFAATSNGVYQNVLSDTLAGITSNESVTVSGNFVSRSTQNASFNIRLNDAPVTTITIGPISHGYNGSEGDAGRERTFSANLIPDFSDGIINMEARYNHNESNSRGFVDWLRITIDRELQAENGYLYFYSPANGTNTEHAQYRLSGFESTPIVMDVTDVTQPKLLSTNASGNTYAVNYYSGNNLQLIAQTNFRTPAVGEMVDSQNLRGNPDYPDYVIVTSETFLEYAEDLASYRATNDGLTPVVVTQEQIFNEFSGGVMDPVAIRDYLKYLYDRALADNQTMPRHLLLFGDTTFDYKGLIEDSHTNYVVTYQSVESLDRIDSFATDDFFGFMDDEEGDFGSGSTPLSHLMDIGVGRISSQSRSEAALAVQKIKDYENPANTGNWQNLFTFAADDDFPDVERNKDLHTLNADGTAQRMNYYEPGLRINKVYEFDYPEEITGAGREIPGATEAFINAFNNGSLVVNYSGHGNESTLSDEGLYRNSYIPRLSNRDKLSVLVTATCQFGRYDDIDAQSGAEQLLFTDNGGIVGAFTTTRVVYTGSGINSGNNYGLNIALSQRMIDRNINGEPLRFGDIFKRTKNTLINGSPVVSTLNSKKFILLGDPATKFRLPEKKAVVTSINGEAISNDTTVFTLNALDEVLISGEIRDLKNNLLSSYHGEAVITVMDAPRTVSLPTDREWVIENRCNLTGCEYEVENDVLFRGKATVENGTFTSNFIIPKDISFSEETGRIILFAQSDAETAGGSFTNVEFNGVNENAVDDGQGPKLDVFLNDERFVNGNLVNGSPQLIIELEDESGINTTGTGVGHEIIATIDTKPKQSFVLNDYYEGNINDYTRGRIEYPLDQLPEGSYTLSVRAWDVHNNPSENEIFFEVASGEELDVRNVYNYPNPMNNATRFTFEHNQPGNPLDVSIRIYTLSGKPVQQIKQSLITTSSYASISWDGRDRDYDRLGNGTYIYVLRVATDTPKGRQATEQIEKLVIIR